MYFRSDFWRRKKKQKQIFGTMSTLGMQNILNFSEMNDFISSWVPITEIVVSFRFN